jgi:hypothetical protein
MLVLGLWACWTGCSKETSFEGEAYSIRLNFVPSANGEPLVLGKSYINPLGEDYAVSRFKYYVSRVSLWADQPTPVAEDLQGIFLIDAESDITRSISVNLNGQTFNRLAFQLGVDSIYNVSGAQAGALDPLNGMFWTWNTGYIMAKLEGSSSLSNSPNQAITYHIGGFQGAEKTQRTIVLDLPGQQSWTLDRNSTTEVFIDVDIDKWFASVHALPILAQAENMTPGPLSVQYADNYATMFRISNIVRRQ